MTNADTLLSDLLELAHTIQAGKVEAPPAYLAGLGERLARQVVDLDAWLVGGGGLPRRWRYQPDTDLSWLPEGGAGLDRKK